MTAVPDGGARPVQLARTAPAILLTATLCVVGGAAARASSPGAGRAAAGSPIVAVLDSGVRVTHAEFDYRGPTSTSDQVVAWWDFTTDRRPQALLPRPGQVWDPGIRTPYDDLGHGTAVAAMAVGLNRAAAKTPSAAPGFRLAIGKVSGMNDAAQNIAAAIRWAVHTVHASVINISIGSATPWPAAFDSDTFAAIDDAWRHGVLVVVADGNGVANSGVVPQPGWATDYAMSPHVLAVGASEPQGAVENTDPEVTAAQNVHTAEIAGDRAYSDDLGTSFAAPFVAGFAARLIQAARMAHRDASPAHIERLIEYVARDTVRPPQSEGYGFVDLAALPRALSHARAGTLPRRPNPDLSGWYVQNVAMPLRTLWCDRLRAVP